ncbi:MAG TPA: ADOP family duplicated permease [Terriglobales bacterium]|nr:ADOP family duplicated permease [Terriglobales bacterium]
MASVKPWFLAVRSLRRRPAYALTTVLVLALGIGATATLFSLVDTVLLQPLPFPQAGRLVTVLEANPAQHQNASLIAPARLADWNRMNQAFVPGLGIVGEYGESDTDTSGALPERLAALRVSPGFFQVLGTAPLLGRVFNPTDDLPTSPGAAVLSYAFWTRRFARSPAALGRQLDLGGQSYTIVGVMPKTFTSSSLDLWLPAKLPAMLMHMREARFYSGIGRLRPGVTGAQAQADLDRVQAQLGRKYPSTDAGWSAQVGNLKEFLVGSFRSTLWLILGAVMLLLVLAVANIAGLTLAQLQGRAREMAIRSAIGASRGQVVATVMREAALLAAAGAAGGGGLAWLGVHAMAGLAPGTLPRMAELQFSLRGWLFTVSLSALAALGFGLGPALAATRTRLAALLASLNAGAPGGRRRLQSGLVIGQLALTVLLLASAGLLLRSYYNLSHVGGGFDTADAFTFHVSAAWNEDRARVGAMQARLLQRLRALPGVEAVGFTNFLPASNASLQFQITLAGLAGAGPGGTYAVGERSISPGYLEALRVPLLAGSACPALSTNLNAPVQALVNRSFVDSYLHGNSVLGREFRFAQDPPSAPANTIVGVVGNVREYSLASPAAPMLYQCIAAGAWPDPDYVVRTAGAPGPAMAAIRGLVRQASPSRAVFGLERLQTVVAAGLEQPRLNARFLSLFAGFALLLAAVGLYSLISLMVAARRREMGVRIALGARPAQIAAQVLASTARLLAWGALAGLALAWAADRLLASVLFGVRPLDLATLASALGALALISALAAWLPARRAASTDPLLALRAD